MKRLAFTIFGLFLVANIASAVEPNQIYAFCSSNPSNTSCFGTFNNTATIHATSTLIGYVFTATSSLTLSGSAFAGRAGYISTDSQWFFTTSSPSVWYGGTCPPNNTNMNLYPTFLGSHQPLVGYAFSNNLASTIINTSNSGYLNWYSPSTCNFPSVIQGTISVRSYPFSSNVIISSPDPSGDIFINNPVNFEGNILNLAPDSYDILRYHILFGGSEVLVSTSTIPSTGTFIFTKDLILPFQGYYTAYVDMYDTSTGSTTSSSIVSFALAQTSLATTITTTGTTSTSTLQYFSTISNQSCGLTDIVCGLQKAMVWLFAPTQASLQQFTDLKSRIENKPPFGYFTLLKNNMASISATSTPIVGLTLPVNTQANIFTPLRTALILVVWFAGAVWLYRRVIKIHL